MARRLLHVRAQEPRRPYTADDKATIEKLYNDGCFDAAIAAALDRSAKAIQTYRLNHGITWRQISEKTTKRRAYKSTAQRCALHLADLATAHNGGYPSLRTGEGRFGTVLRPLASFAEHAGLMGSPAALCADDATPGRSQHIRSGRPA